MSAQTNDHRHVPPDIESPRAKLVYLYLWSVDAATVDEMQDDLNMPKISLLSLLQALASQDHVDRSGDGYACA